MMQFKNFKRYFPLILLLIGIIGWLGPILTREEITTRPYEVERKQIDNLHNYVTDITIYRPQAEGVYPAVLFGAGSGADKVTYTKYAQALLEEGFVVLVYGPTYGRQEAFTNDETGWGQITDYVMHTLEYLQKLDYVDASRIIVGGHSGGANTAYRLAVREPAGLQGVIAIAGRWAPTLDKKLQTNLLLATGSEDEIVPPARLEEVALQLTGRQFEPGRLYGDFADKTALKMVYAEGSGHLTESWDSELITEAASWAARSIGAVPRRGYEIADLTFRQIILMLISGLAFFTGSIILIRKVLYNKFKSGLIEKLESVLYFALLYVILVTTLSDSFLYLPPVAYRLPQYVTAGIIAVILGGGTYLLPKKLSQRFKILLNAGYLLAAIALFVFITDNLLIQTPSHIWMPTIIAKSGMIFVFLNIISLLLFWARLSRRQIIGFNILVLTWLLPLTMPLL